MTSLAALRSVAVLSVLAIATGCSSQSADAETTEADATETEADTESSTDGAKEEDEARTSTKTPRAALVEPAVPAECPNVPAPTCADGEHFKMKLDANDCLVPTCVACATAPVPVCKTGEVLKSSKDGCGCGFSYCFSAE